MAHHQAHPGHSDRKYINLSEDYEVRDWAKHFNVTEDELREAVKNAGSNAEEVEAYLNKKTSNNGK